MLKLLRKIIGYDNPIRKGWHRLKGMLAAIRYGFPARKMTCIGVTGTNGKTTTTHMVEHILRTAGKKVAMLSTSEFVISGLREPNLSKKTTMSPFLTQKFLKKCLAHGIEYVVIESSSHALHQSRLWGIPFKVATITNITHEHLDYHGTMKKYAEAKKILFDVTAKNKGTMVLNTADEFYEMFNELSGKKIPYGISKGDLQAHKPSFTKYGSSFSLHYRGNKAEVNLPMTGEFNVENSMAAAGACLALDLLLDEIKMGLESFEGVGGRMERIKSPKGFEVIVDFALTPDALERLYKVLKETASGRIIGLIGSCGERDQQKRPEMGRIVARYCDLTIVTDEEPYSEDPMQIMQAILDGAKEIQDLNDGLLLIEDRKDAMDHAIKNAEKGDLVVVTGMGSFTTRGMAHGPIAWDDREVARELINKYK